MIKPFSATLFTALIGSSSARADSIHSGCRSDLVPPTPVSVVEHPSASAEVANELQFRATLLIQTEGTNPDLGFAVYSAPGRDIPRTVRELGRAREVAFRAIGSGTGRDLDLDRFDADAWQVVCWDKRTKAVAGGLRLSPLDHLVPRDGAKGAYANQFIDFNPDFARLISRGTLEIGRQFVAPTYQRGPVFSLTWLGLGQFLRNHSRYRRLLGMISIGGHFEDGVRKGMGEYLIQTRPHPLAHLTRARTDLHVPPRRYEDGAAALPPLVRTYLRLNARFMTFNLDQAFNTYDGLAEVDLDSIPSPTLGRYLGPDVAAGYGPARGTTAAAPGNRMVRYGAMPYSSDSNSDLRLVLPDAKFKDTYLRGLAELQAEGWLWYADHDLKQIAGDFESYLEQIRAMTTYRGGLMVPETEFWGIRDGEFVGRISIRHELNDDLREVGGHIGYDVVPRFRNHGIASAMLGHALPRAKALGIDRALLTVTEDNAASARVIEKNGGVLKARRAIMGGRLLKRYYWIEL